MTITLEKALSVADQLELSSDIVKRDLGNTMRLCINAAALPGERYIKRDYLAATPPFPGAQEAWEVIHTMGLGNFGGESGVPPSWPAYPGGYLPDGVSFLLDLVNNYAWVDNVDSDALSLLTVARASVGYAENVAGVWSSFASGVARRTDKGLLIEEARTNSLRNNSMQGAVAGTPGTAPTNWSSMGGFGATHSIVGTGVENGIDYIDVRISGTASSAGIPVEWFEALSVIAAVPSQVWTQSCWLKLAAGSLTNVTNISLNTYETDSGGAFLRNNAGPVPVTGTLTQFSRTWTVGASTAWLRPGVFVAIAGAGAIDITLRIGWPQLELGAFVTSPIRTTTVAVTRAADAVTMPASGLSTEYTLFGEAESPNGIQASGTPAVAQLDNGTLAERTLLARASVTRLSTGFAIAGNVSQANPTGAAWADATLGRVVLAAKLNDFALCFNGGAVITDAAGTMPVNPTILRLGTNTAVYFGGYLRRVAYWNTRLTNADLQAVTR